MLCFAQFSSNGAFHILLNMMAFHSIGSGVEHQVGSLVLFGLVFLFTCAVGSLYLLFQVIASAVTSDPGKYMYQSAVGFSGVIFAFYVMETGQRAQGKMQRNRRRMSLANVHQLIVSLCLLRCLCCFLFSSLQLEGRYAYAQARSVEFAYLGNASRDAHCFTTILEQD